MLVAVPTEISPELPVDREAEAELEGEREPLAVELAELDGDKEAELDTLAELEGESEAEVEELALELGLTLELGETERLTELDGDLEKALDCEELAEPDGETEADGLSEAEVEELAELEGLSEALVDELGEVLEDGETEDDGERDAEPAPGRVTTLANNLTRQAPVTVNKVAAPTAPALVAPVKVICLRAWIDQSGEVTGALLRLFWRAIVYFYPLFSGLILY